MGGPAAARVAARWAWRWCRCWPAPAPAPAWRWRSRPGAPGRVRRAGPGHGGALILNAGTLHGVPALHGSPVPGTDQLPPTMGQRLLAAVLVLPLPLAARYPMLAWRAGWLALLLSPLVPAAWWGGWPWGPPQVAALLGAFAPGRDPPAAGGAGLDVGADPDPVGAVAGRATSRT